MVKQQIRSPYLDFLQDHQIYCWMTHTTPETHKFVLENVHDSVHIQESKNGILHGVKF